MNPSLSPLSPRAHGEGISIQPLSLLFERNACPDAQRARGDKGDKPAPAYPRVLRAPGLRTLANTTGPDARAAASAAATMRCERTKT